MRHERSPLGLLRSRVDVLTLFSSKAFSLPFDELVVFSSNLSLNDLMDPAFPHRIPCKLETHVLTLGASHAIFPAVVGKAGVELSDEIFDYVVHELTEVVKK